jgi:heme-degrading monooxygenase HmoA
MNSGVSERIYRIDRFKVPASARDEFIRRVRETHDYLRTLPGFIEDHVLEQTGGPGVFNFVTVAVWANTRAIDSARQAVIARRKESGFDPQEMFSRLGIEADLASYSIATTAKS